MAKKRLFPWMALIGLTLLIPVWAQAQTREDIQARAERIRNAMKNPTARYEQPVTRTAPAAQTASTARTTAQPAVHQTVAEPTPADAQGGMVPEGEIYEEGMMDYAGDCGSACGGCGGCGSCDGCMTCVNWTCLIPLGYDPWFKGEYLLWWTKGAQYPALVTTSPDGTAQDEAGVLGLDTTQILLGATDYNSGSVSGGRFTLGEWLGPCRKFGIEGTYMFLGEQRLDYTQDYNDRTILARPFFNLYPSTDPVEAARQDAQLITYPDFTQGDLAVSLTTEVQGAEFLVRHAAIQDCAFELDFLAGWRYCRLKDRMIFDEYFESLGQAAAGTTIDLEDMFSTTNNFNGFEMGVEARHKYCRWSLEVLAKLALGNTNSVAHVNGRTITTVDGQDPVTSAYGLLALPSNIGRYERDSFAVVPEIGVELSYDFTCRLKGTVAYSFIYWSQVARAGDQIDTDLNLTQTTVPTGELRPDFRFNMTDFWMQGVNFGLEYEF